MHDIGNLYMHDICNLSVSRPTGRRVDNVLSRDKDYLDFYTICTFGTSLGYADLGAFGSASLETPRMDALAAEGMALDHFYAANAICSPSRRRSRIA